MLNFNSKKPSKADNIIFNIPTKGCTHTTKGKLDT